MCVCVCEYNVGASGTRVIVHAIQRTQRLHTVRSIYLYTGDRSSVRLRIALLRADERVCLDDRQMLFTRSRQSLHTDDSSPRSTSRWQLSTGWLTVVVFA